MDVMFVLEYSIKQEQFHIQEFRHTIADNVGIVLRHEKDWVSNDWLPIYCGSEDKCYDELRRVIIELRRRFPDYKFSFDENIL